MTAKAAAALEEAVGTEQKAMVGFQATVGVLGVVMAKWAELCSDRDVAVKANTSLKNAMKVVFEINN